MPEWPKQLPCMQLGSTFEPIDPQIRTRMQSGRTRIRRGFTAVPEDFDARWIFDDLQAAIFEDFYWVTLEAGTRWFDMPVWLPLLKGTRQVQFQGAFARHQVTGGRGDIIWEYSARMQHYLTASATPTKRVAESWWEYFYKPF